jgi:predicted outer membrane repeat protein
MDGFTFTRGATTQPNNDIGGAFTAHLSSPVVRNCVFRSNHAERGGAVWFGGHGSPHFVNCVFEANTARIGGAIYAVNTPYTVRLTACVIHGNEATSTAGGILGYNVPLVLEDCVITRNLATSDGGGMTLSNCYPSFVSRCTLYGNAAPSGGGVSVQGSMSLTVDHAIIAMSEDGGAVALQPNSSMTLSCSDLFGNYGGDWTGPIAAQLGVNGNFSFDPMFCNAPSLDLTLQAGSPCAPGNHPEGSDCGLVGARPVACGGVPVLERSWGAIKAMWGE